MGLFNIGVPSDQALVSMSSSQLRKVVTRGMTDPDQPNGYNRAQEALRLLVARHDEIANASARPARIAYDNRDNRPHNNGNPNQNGNNNGNQNNGQPRR